MIKCSNCGHENHDNAQICDVCGVLLNPAIVGVTRKRDDTDYEEGTPKWGSARFNGALVLDVLDGETEHRFVLDANELNDLVIGRRDPDTGDAPPVDLTDNDALEKGVSRKHAMIIRVDNGALAIVDNNSANGTFLNGHRLVPQQPRILRDGDDVRFGMLTVRITFQGSVQPQ